MFIQRFTLITDRSLLLSASEELNQALAGTNPAGGQGVLNLGSPDFKSSALTTWPCCLLPLKGVLKNNSDHHFTFAVTTLGKAEENNFFSVSSSNYKGAGMAQW